MQYANTNGNAAGNTTGQPNGTYQNTSNSGMNRTSMSRVMARRIPVSGAGDVAATVMANFERTLKDSRCEDYIKLNVLDHRNSSAHFSCIIATGKEDIPGAGDVVCFHTLILEGSAPEPIPYQDNVHGQNIEVHLAASDAYNQTLVEMITHLLEGVYPGATLVDAGCSVIHREMDPTNLQGCQQFISNAVNAIGATFNSLNPIAGETFSVALFNQNDRCAVRIEYNPNNPPVTPDGLPIASQICVSLMRTPRNAQNAHTLNVQGVEVISTVDAIIDLQYSQPSATDPQRVYIGNVILTATTTDFSLSTESLLFGFANAALIGKSGVWVGAFQSGFASAGKQLQDITAFGFDVPSLIANNAEPKRLPLEGQMDNQTIMALFQRVAYMDQLKFSYRAIDASENNWVDSILYSAACGSRDAHNELIAAADRLTLGHFSTLYQGGPLVTNSNIRVPVGYYIDRETNQRVSLDRINNYLSMLNLAADVNAKLAQEWEATRNPTRPLQVRTAEQISILRQILGESVRITGYANEVCLMPALTVTMLAACRAAGLDIDLNAGNFQYGVGSRPDFNQTSNGAINVAELASFGNGRPAYTGGNTNASGIPGRWM